MWYNYIFYLRTTSKLWGEGVKFPSLRANFPFPIEKGKFGCGDRRGRRSRCLSLQCKVGKFPKYWCHSLWIFYLVQNIIFSAYFIETDFELFWYKIMKIVPNIIFFGSAVAIAVSCGYDTWFAVRLVMDYTISCFARSFWDTYRIPRDHVSPSQTHRCPEGLWFPPKWSLDHFYWHLSYPTPQVYMGFLWLFCFRSTPQRSLILGPLSRVHFGESLVNRLYSEIGQTYLSIEAQCVSHHYPRWTATNRVVKSKGAALWKGCDPALWSLNKAAVNGNCSERTWIWRINTLHHNVWTCTKHDRHSIVMELLKSKLIAQGNVETCHYSREWGNTAVCKGSDPCGRRLCEAGSDLQ